MGSSTRTSLADFAFRILMSCQGILHRGKLHNHGSAIDQNAHRQLLTSSVRPFAAGLMGEKGHERAGAHRIEEVGAGCKRWRGKEYVIVIGLRDKAEADFRFGGGNVMGFFSLHHCWDWQCRACNSNGPL